MVYYFKSTAVDPPAFIYVGKDKVESPRDRGYLCSYEYLTDEQMKI